MRNWKRITFCPFKWPISMSGLLLLHSSEAEKLLPNSNLKIYFSRGNIFPSLTLSLRLLATTTHSALKKANRRTISFFVLFKQRPLTIFSGRWFKQPFFERAELVLMELPELIADVP